MDDIKVSVLCVTYNHEQYIEQAINSILEQKTNFKFEILLNDDASTDNTTAIIRKYQQKFPEIIKPIYWSENQYSKGVVWIPNLVHHCNGKYIALCEGDDYWCDVTKLQNQADLLDNYAEYAACGHNAVIVDDNSNAYTYDVFGEYMFEKKNICKGTVNFCIDSKFAHTCTIMLRKSIFDLYLESSVDEYNSIKIPGECVISALIAANGYFFYDTKMMACYRYITTHGGSWSAKVKNKNTTGYYYKGFVRLGKFMEKYHKVEKMCRMLETIQLHSSINQFFLHATSENKDILTEILSIEDF